LGRTSKWRASCYFLKTIQLWDQGTGRAKRVMDRIVHNAIRIQMGEVNMRERTMPKG